VLRRVEVQMWMPILNNRAKKGVGKKGWRCTAQGFRVSKYPRETVGLNLRGGSCRLPSEWLRGKATRYKGNVTGGI